MGAGSVEHVSSGEALGAVSAPAPKRFYHPELDALRFLAFLAIYWYHAALALGMNLSVVDIPWYAADWWARNLTIAGAFSVDLFFTLSSFLITSLLLREIQARGHLDVRAFWMRRILRIWPLYFAFLLGASVIERAPARYVVPYAFFLGNWADIAWGLPEYVISPLWSVSFEEQFYVFWPLLLFVLPVRRLGAVCVGMIVVSMTVRAGAVWLSTTHLSIWQNTFARLDPIAVGALVALLVHRRPIEVRRVTRTALLAAGVTVAVWAAYRLPPLPLRAEAVWMYVAIALACGGVLVATMTRGRSPIARQPLVYLGRVSYGLYVFHEAGLEIFAKSELCSGLWAPWRIALGLVFTMAAAMLSYHLLEEPFLRLKDRFTYVRNVPVASAPA